MDILTKISQERGKDFYERVQPRPRLYPHNVFPFLHHGGDVETVKSSSTRHAVVELAGESQSGKSVTLVKTIVRLVLPKATHGLESEVVFINVDHHIKKDHFVKCVEMELARHKNITLSDQRIILAQSLARLWIIDIFDAESYHVSLTKLEKLMFVNRNISVIAVDSFSYLLQLFRASKYGQPIYQEKFYEQEVRNLTSQFPNVLLIYLKQDQTPNLPDQAGKTDFHGPSKSPSCTLSIHLTLDKVNSAIRYDAQASGSSGFSAGLAIFQAPFSLKFIPSERNHSKR